MNEEDKNFERRINQRFDVQLPINLGNKDVRLQSTTKNISCSGVYCQVNCYIPVMTKLEITMDIWVIQNRKKVKKTIVTNAVVVRIDPEVESPECDDYYIGLFFLSLEAKHRELIALYIQQTFLASNN